MRHDVSSTPTVESSATPENSPAFPVAWPAPNAPEPGMSLRDWFASQALIGTCLEIAKSGQSAAELARPAAAVAYILADAMLAERAKVQP